MKKECPGKKTELIVTLKGFDIRNPSPRVQAVLAAFRRRIIASFARALGVDASQLEVTFKAGSAIVIVGVPEGSADGALPSGQNVLEDLKSLPDVEEMLEEGTSIDECFVAPPELPDEAAAVGDPHLSRLTAGGTADMCCHAGHCHLCSEDNA